MQHKDLIKYLKGNASQDEQIKVENWILASEENTREFYKIKAIYVAATFDETAKAIQTDAGYHQFSRAVKPKSIYRKLLSQIKYAAAILVIALASTYFLRDSIFNNQTENTTPIIVNNNIEPGVEKATLTLEDGSTVVLEKGSTYQAKNANSNGEQIIYQPTTDNQQLTTNVLTIPRGGQFQITLADGTKIWLNSESQLKYPVAFVEGKTREVELLYGEAYFEVSPSTEHKGANFKVITPHPDNYRDRQEIEVLGTEFNIKAYKDENNIYTTLVEGKVAVRYEGEKQNLMPNQQSNVNLLKNSLTVSTVNVSYEISWKAGVFNFERKSLKDIMKVLSRWYNMDVIFENKNLENARFNGLINKRYPIKDILSVLQSSNIINTYEINNNTLILR